MAALTIVASITAINVKLDLVKAELVLKYWTTYCFHALQPNIN